MQSDATARASELDLPAPTKTSSHPEQLQRIAELKAFAAKKQKVAQVLTDADLADEAEPHQKAAEKALAEAQSIENHLPEPTTAQ